MPHKMAMYISISAGNVSASGTSADLQQKRLAAPAWLHDKQQQKVVIHGDYL
jgi:hypothetical protein